MSLDLAAATRTFFRAVPVKPFESPFVQVGAYGGDAGTVRRASYGPLAPWAFLVAWHAEFEERADKVLDLDTRGATRLPRPDGPLRRASDISHLIAECRRSTVGSITIPTGQRVTTVTNMLASP